MLLVEKIKSTSFSPAESIIVDFILENPEKIDDMTTQEIATITHTNPTSLVRISKKVGYNGWLDFKKDFIEEWKYLNSNFTTVDANFPFNKNDNILSIASKLATLESNTIKDTLSLIDYQTLNQVKQLILKSNRIKLFASHTNALIAQDFIVKMRRINIDITSVNIYQYGEFEALHTDENTCVILISYTGENKNLIKVTELLRAQGASIITLTSIGDNTLSLISDCCLRITTRERLYSKIANFATNTSLSYLLDVIYAVVFSANYNENLENIIKIGQQFDGRKSSVDIMQERDNLT